MDKIDIEKWGEFVIGELFDKIEKPSVYHTRHVIESDYGIPYVVRTKFNNGIKYRVELLDEMLPSPAGVISFGSENSTFFYQSEEWISGRDIYYIDTRHLSEAVCRFLIACLQTITKKYDYNNGLFPKLLKKEKIKLPITEKNKPNWGYMEQYMIAVENEVDKAVDSLQKVKVDKKKIDVSNFKRFNLYDDDLFTIDSGTKLDKIKMTEINPTVNFVGRANANNGVTAFVDEIEGTKPYSKGYLTISLGGEYLGSCFVQEKPFYTSQNVNVLIPKHEMSIYCKKYIATMIFKEGRLHYKAFVDELNRHMNTDFSILLPVDENEKISWDYMEKYMKEIEKKCLNNIEAL